MEEESPEEEECEIPDAALRRQLAVIRSCRLQRPD